jgi:hypothetical protein
LTGYFSAIIPPFTNRGLAWSASGDERGTKTVLEYKRPRKLECDSRGSRRPHRIEEAEVEKEEKRIIKRRRIRRRKEEEASSTVTPTI